MAEDKLVLSLTAGTVDAYCDDLVRQSPNGGHALAGLVALQSFVAAISHPDSRFTTAYKAIQTVIEARAARVREALLEEGAADLARALRQADGREVVRIHGSLSRNGFWQAAQRATGLLAPDELVAAAAWAQAWCRDAKTRAEAASGYPDALDLRGAGISPGEYAAMTEIAGYLDAARRH
jgi:hypothetical protein